MMHLCLVTLGCGVIGVVELEGHDEIAIVGVGETSTVNCCLNDPTMLIEAVLPTLAQLDGRGIDTHKVNIHIMLWVSNHFETFVNM